MYLSVSLSVSLSLCLSLSLSLKPQVCCRRKGRSYVERTTGTTVTPCTVSLLILSNPCSVRRHATRGYPCEQKKSRL
ncbi:hypothetical protein T484DRAFT_1988883 [Baffinella frigidus]|nr:hypothetical protein T484DRAFT_1988883 [Cryptophyta sp. CCMP2293]